MKTYRLSTFDPGATPDAPWSWTIRWVHLSRRGIGPALGLLHKVGYVAGRAVRVEQEGRSMRSKAEIAERLVQHRVNLELWRDGFLAPTEPDEEERERIQDRLRVAIHELEWLLGIY